MRKLFCTSYDKLEKELYNRSKKMEIKGPEQFTNKLANLFETVKQADPQTCLNELQKFGKTMGSDQVHQFVDSFESITGGHKNILKSVLLGQTMELAGGALAKNLISTELKQQLQSGLLEAHLGDPSRLLSALHPNLGSEGLNVLGNTLTNQLGDAFKNFGSMPLPPPGTSSMSSAQDIINNPFIGDGFKQLAGQAMDMAGSGLKQVINGIYPQLSQVQNQLGSNPLDGLISNLGNTLGSFLPDDLTNALRTGGGQNPLNNILSGLLNQSAVKDKLGGYLDQAVQQLGGWDSFNPQQILDGLKGGNIGALTDPWFSNVGDQIGKLVGDDLASFLPKNVDWSNPEKALGKISHNIVDGFLFDKEKGLGLDRKYTGNWGTGDKFTKGWGDPGAKGIVDNFGIGYGKMGKTLWEGKFGGFEVGKLDEKAAGAWGEAYAKGQTTLLEASARAFGDIDPEAWSAMIGVEARAILAGVDYEVGYKTPRLNIGGHEVGIDTKANLHAMVGAEGRLMAEISLKDDPHIHIGGEAFAGAKARLDGSAGLTVDGKTLAGVRGGVEGWAGVGVKGDLDVGYKDGKFSFDVALGAALGLGFEVDFGFDVDVGAIGDVLADVGSTVVGGLEDVGEGIADVAEDVGGAIADGAEAVGDAIGDAAEAVGDAISSVFSGW